MSDPTGHNGLGVRVRPPNNLLTDGDQIADNEPESYSYRLDGVLVQPYWSFAYNGFIVPDGNIQDFDLSPTWKDGMTVFTGTYNLTVHSDPFGAFPLHNNVVLDTTAAGGVQVSVNGQTAAFDPGQISTTNVITDWGSNYIDVYSTPLEVGVYLSGGTTATSYDTVTIGKNGSLVGIADAVNVANAGGHTTLELDDSSDTFGQTVLITNNSVSGLAPNYIYYTAPSTVGGPG